MAGMSWGQMTPEERLIAEQAVLNFRELNQTCDAAAAGTVLNVCERLAMRQGRELIRRTIEIALNEQADAVEQSRLSASAPNKTRRRGRAAE